MLPMLHIDLPPTDYALRMRKPFMAVLVALSLLVAGKFIIHDFWGAVNTLFCVLMGFFVLSGQYEVNASSAPFFCVMATISGIFDSISCILYFHHSTYRMFESKAPAIVILAQLVFLASPVLLFGSAAMAYSIFADCRDSAQEAMPFALARMEWEGVPRQQVPPRPPQQQPRAPVPFQGHGQRLGDN
mmetsp:Transcript_70960/g.229740  ORF Transcript_70960/g.229740 Transcript_70960/m.229740 type:complete len:187 (-) Transcript_70960:75-635(-)